jgi:hypothetical protein
VQARGVPDSNLKVLVVQEVKFKWESPSGSLTFLHSIVVCMLEICIAGILGLDFLLR